MAMSKIAEKHSCVGSTSKFGRYSFSGVFYGVSAAEFKSYVAKKKFGSVGDAFKSEIKKEMKEKIE